MENCPETRKYCLSKPSGESIFENCDGKKYNALLKLTELTQKIDDASVDQRRANPNDACHAWDTAWLTIIKEIENNISEVKNRKSLISASAKALSTHDFEKIKNLSLEFDLNALFGGIINVAKKKWMPADITPTNCRCNNIDIDECGRQLAKVIIDNLEEIHSSPKWNELCSALQPNFKKINDLPISSPSSFNVKPNDNPNMIKLAELNPELYETFDVLSNVLPSIDGPALLKSQEEYMKIILSILEICKEIMNPANQLVGVRFNRIQNIINIIKSGLDLTNFINLNCSLDGGAFKDSLKKVGRTVWQGTKAVGLGISSSVVGLSGFCLTAVGGCLGNLLCPGILWKCSSISSSGTGNIFSNSLDQLGDLSIDYIKEACGRDNKTAQMCAYFFYGLGFSVLNASNYLEKQAGSAFDEFKNSLSSGGAIKTKRRKYRKRNTKKRKKRKTKRLNRKY